jgi:hypothetical protein
MKPILVVNPANDRVFAAFAETLIDHGVLSITEFESRLLTVYPLAAAHARDLAAEPILIWYVYREGHWVNSRSPANELECQRTMSDPSEDLRQRRNRTGVTPSM